MSESRIPEQAGYRIISTTAYAGVQTVHLYDETWDHISKQHPEFENRLPSLEHAIEDTISHPTLVTVSTSSPTTSVVFTSSTNIKGAGYMLSVPVRIIGDTKSGRVTTAMFASAPKGEVLYVKGHENG